MVKPGRIQSSSSEGVAPSPQAKSPLPWSAFADCSPVDGPDTGLSNCLSTQSTCLSQDSAATKPPTLKEILVDAAPPPWSLSAFMAYLSQNHCMETLEFTLDSQRYTEFYNQFASVESKGEEVRGWWQRLMETYIVPCAPREVNIPARVRDRLLDVPYDTSPPNPTVLDETSRIIYELMNDSLLVPFLQSVAPLNTTNSGEDHALSPRHRSRNSAGRAVGLPLRTDSEGLTDDSDSNSPPAMEPMTPPTTPPNSEYTFNTSPGGFQRAVAAHNKGWKRMGAKLGFNRKGFNRRSTTSGPECDASAETKQGQQS